MYCSRIPKRNMNTKHTAQTWNKQKSTWKENPMPIMTKRDFHTNPKRPILSYLKTTQNSVIQSTQRNKENQPPSIPHVHGVRCRSHSRRRTLNHQPSVRARITHYPTVVMGLERAQRWESRWPRRWRRRWGRDGNGRKNGNKGGGDCH